MLKGGRVKRLFRAVLLLSLAALGLAAGSVAVAQEAPPCPCPEPPPQPDPVWFGRADFSFLSTSGNTDTTSIGAALELNYRPKPWLFTIKGGYLKGATDGVTTAESFAGSLRASRDLTERIDVFVGGSYLRNRFSGIDNLYGFDGGAGYKLLLGPVHFLRVEGGVGYTHEEDIITDPITITTSRNYANAKSGLGYKWQFTKNAYFTNDFAFLADLDDTANWFITDKAAITANISKIFALQASWTLLYRNQPVPTFKKTDTVTAIGLVAKFP
jgi:putative salt-induced outer membrane protein